jgi:hypothetical protein
VKRLSSDTGAGAAFADVPPAIATDIPATPAAPSAGKAFLRRLAFGACFPRAMQSLLCLYEIFNIEFPRNEASHLILKPDCDNLVPASMQYPITKGSVSDKKVSFARFR